MQGEQQRATCFEWFPNGEMVKNQNGLSALPWSTTCCLSLYSDGGPYLDILGSCFHQVFGFMTYPANMVSKKIGITSDMWIMWAMAFDSNVMQCICWFPWDGLIYPLIYKCHPCSLSDIECPCCRFPQCRLVLAWRWTSCFHAPLWPIPFTTWNMKPEKHGFSLDWSFCIPV